jgi:hypothetical protein
MAMVASTSFTYHKVSARPGPAAILDSVRRLILELLSFSTAVKVAAQANLLKAAAAFRGGVQEEQGRRPGQGAGAGEGEGAQAPVQGRRDHAAAALPRRPLLPHRTRSCLSSRLSVHSTNLLSSSDA